MLFLNGDMIFSTTVLNFTPRQLTQGSVALNMNAARGALISSAGKMSMNSLEKGHWSFGKLRYEGPFCQTVPSKTFSGVVDGLVGISAGFSNPGTCIMGFTTVSSATSDRLDEASAIRLAKYGASKPPDFSTALIVHWLSIASVTSAGLTSIALITTLRRRVKIKYLEALLWDL